MAAPADPPSDFASDPPSNPQALLGKDQQRVFQHIVNLQQSAIVLASAGCGKTFLIEALKKAIPRAIVCAPTSGAAFLLGCDTIHRVFGFPIGVSTLWEHIKCTLQMCRCFVDEENKELFKRIGKTPAVPTTHAQLSEAWMGAHRIIYKLFPPAKPGTEPLEHQPTCRLAALRHTPLLIVDEISMAKMLEAMDKVLRVVMADTSVPIEQYPRPAMSRPFGGKQVVAFGDLRQLPCVIDSEQQERAHECLAQLEDVSDWDYTDPEAKAALQYVRAAILPQVQQFPSFQELAGVKERSIFDDANAPVSNHRILEMTQAFRQQGPWLELLQRMRFGKLNPTHDMAMLTSRRVRSYAHAVARAVEEGTLPPGADMTALFSTNRDVNRHNGEKLSENRRSKMVTMRSYCVPGLVEEEFAVPEAQQQQQRASGKRIAAPLSALSTQAYRWNEQPFSIPVAQCKIPPMFTVAVGARVMTAVNIVGCSELPRNRMGTVLRLGAIDPAVYPLLKKPLENMAAAYRYTRGDIAPLILRLPDRLVSMLRNDIKSIEPLYGRHASEVRCPAVTRDDVRECASELDYLLLENGFVEDDDLGLDPAHNEVKWTCSMMLATVVLLDPISNSRNMASTADKAAAPSSSQLPAWDVAIILPQCHSLRIEGPELHFSGTVNLFSMPLKLSFGATVHSFQGSTLDSAFITMDTYMLGQPSMPYVAASRVRNVEGLYLVCPEPTPAMFRSDTGLTEWERIHLQVQREMVLKESLLDALGSGTHWAKHFEAPASARDVVYEFNQRKTCITVQLQRKRDNTDHPSCDTLNRDLLLRGGGSHVKWSVMCPECRGCVEDGLVSECDVVERDACRRLDLVLATLSASSR